MQTHSSNYNPRLPVFNVYHQNPLMNNNILVALNPEMAEEIVKLVHETCSSEEGLQDREEYPHLYSLCDRLQSNLDWSRMQALRRHNEYPNCENGRETSRVGVDSFLNNVDSGNGYPIKPMNRQM